MQGKHRKPGKKLASVPPYVSPNQLTIEGFETPFERNLNETNRWVLLARAISWDKIVPIYERLFNSSEGRMPINGRVIIGAMIIKHLEGFTDRETIQHITENMYMQYFLGYSSYTDEAPFTAPLFVAIRKRMTLELTNKISDVIAEHCITEKDEEAIEQKHDDSGPNDSTMPPPIEQSTASHETTPPDRNGKLIMDATVAPQNITYPTDLKLLNAARIKSEELIDVLYCKEIHKDGKPRTYRKIARKLFLNTNKKKAKSKKEIYKANGRQLRFLKRNLKHIDNLLAAYEHFPLSPRQQKYLMVLNTVADQQSQLHSERSTTIEHRIVNIHQPHVRPIVRGKERAKTEFGSKLQVSVVNGYTFIDRLSWDAFNEGQWLQYSVKRYQKQMGFYPEEVLADQIYCTRENRSYLKELGIKLSAKPLGRPSKTAVANHVRPGDRNPIEGKFGQAKLAYGLGNIMAKLKETSESWIASIALVLNLVRLTRHALLCVIQIFFEQIGLKKWGGKFSLIFPPQLSYLASPIYINTVVWSDIELYL